MYKSQPLLHIDISHQFLFPNKSQSTYPIKIIYPKNVIIKCEHKTGENISPIFIRQKPDGSCRLILNLKNLNEAMPYIHFKMETLQSFLSLITPGCYLASLSLKDASYFVLILPDHTKFLKFIWKISCISFYYFQMVYVVAQENLQN